MQKGWSRVLQEVSHTSIPKQRLIVCPELRQATAKACQGFSLSRKAKKFWPETRVAHCKADGPFCIACVAFSEQTASVVVATAAGAGNCVGRSRASARISSRAPTSNVAIHPELADQGLWPQGLGPEAPG